MSSEAHSISLVAPVVLLAAAVIAVPIFKRIGLGSVLGYLIAGLIIGPFGFAFFQVKRGLRAIISFEKKHPKNKMT